MVSARVIPGTKPSAQALPCVKMARSRNSSECEAVADSFRPHESSEAQRAHQHPQSHKMLGHHPCARFLHQGDAMNRTAAKTPAQRPISRLPVK